MSFSPHTHKYFGVLIAVIVLAVLVLGVRVGKLSELFATVSFRGATANTVIRQIAAPQYGSARQFLDALKQNSHVGTKGEINNYFMARNNSKTLTVKPVTPLPPPIPAPVSRPRNSLKYPSFP